MSNPFKPHALGVFSERDTIDEAMAYAHQLINALDASDRIAALTALMVLINTAAKVWPEAPADEPLAVRLSMVQADLDSRLEALASRVVDLEQSKPSVTDATVQVIQAQIREWADDSFNDLADDWLRNHADLGQEIENWMENNFDLENDVRNILSEANLSITF